MQDEVSEKLIGVCINGGKTEGFFALFKVLPVYSLKAAVMESTSFARKNTKYGEKADGKPWEAEPEETGRKWRPAVKH